MHTVDSSTLGSDVEGVEYGDEVVKVEPYGIERIPDSERHGNVRSQFTVYCAGNLTLGTLTTGFFPVFYGLSLAQALSAAFVGTLAGALVMGLLSSMGARLGVAQQVMGRGPLGFYANYIPVAIVSLFASVGWAAVTSVFGAWALQGVIDIPFWIAALLIAAAYLTIGFFGYNMVHFINRWISVVAGVLFVVITIIALGKADGSFGVNVEAPYYIGETGGWITSAGLFFGYLLTWTPVASDYSRYLPASTPPRKVVLWTALGNFVPMVWLGFLGILVAHFAGELEPIQALKELTGGFSTVTLLVVVLAAIPACSLSTYGGSLSLLSLGVPTSRTAAALLISATAYVAALLLHSDLYGTFYDFVVVSAYLIGPYMTVIALDYVFFRMRDPGRAREYYDRSRVVEWGFIAWVAGCAASVPFWVWTRYTGPIAAAHPDWGDLSYYVGAAVSAIVFLLLIRLRPLSSLLGRVETVPAPEPQLETTT